MPCTPPIWLLLACCCAAAAGCGSDRALTVGSFAGDGSTAAVSSNGTTYAAAPPQTAPASASIWASDIQLSSPIPSQTVPTDSAAARNRPNTPLVLDAKVGDINGRPILASVFLQDLMPRLEALRLTSPSRAAWIAEARQIIGDKVQLTVQDEVLYREGKAQLPEEIRQGLFSFVQMARQNIRRSYSGSAIRADQKLREQTGIGLEETLDLETRQAVIGEVLRTVADSYPEPTWADVQNEYERRYAEFNPPMRVFARIIMSPDEPAADGTHARLLAGESFQSLASDSSLNRFRSAEGGLIDDEGRDVTGSIADAELDGISDLNAALVELDPGDWAGPIAFGGNNRIGFVMLERVEQTSRSLEDGDLQLQLRAEIQWKRRIGAQEAYIRELLEAANLGAREQDSLTEDLLDVAHARVFGVPR